MKGKEKQENVNESKRESLLFILEFYSLMQKKTVITEINLYLIYKNNYINYILFIYKHYVYILSIFYFYTTKTFHFSKRGQQPIKKTI